MTRPRSTYKYPRIAVTSRDERFRFETDDVTPKPTGWWARAFGSSNDRYAYTLWARGQDDPDPASAPYREFRDRALFRVERSGACPWAAWLHGDGRVAVLHADDTLLLFQSDGVVTGTTNVLDELRRDASCTRHVAWSTAGSFWTESPIARWIRTASGPRVRFVLPHGQRVHFNVSGARDEADSLDDDDDDEAWLLLELRDALRDRNFNAAGELARLAGRGGYQAAIPWLVKLQDKAPATSSCTDSVWSYSRALPRSFAQQALVRLGATFEPTNAFGDVRKPRPARWAGALDTLAPSATPAEVFDRVGSPFVCSAHGGDLCWEYARPMAAGWAGVRLIWRNKRLAASAPFDPASWFA